MIKYLFLFQLSVLKNRIASPAILQNKLSVLGKLQKYIVLQPKKIIFKN